jgi:hypothetical protein
MEAPMNAITETPVDDWEADGPPWLRPGGYRRDGKPDRGPWLAKLSWVSLICSIIARGGFLGWLALWGLNVLEHSLQRRHMYGALVRPLFHVLEAVAFLGPFAMILFALVGFPLGCIAWIVARRDRAERERGERDPAGLPETIAIQRRAGWANLWNALCLIPGLLVVSGLVILLVIVLSQGGLAM